MAQSSDSDDSARSTRRSGPSITDDVWDEAINDWINSAMRNSAMSQSTEAWNHMVASLPALRKILESKL